MASKEQQIEIDALPEVPSSARPRTIVFDAIGDEQASILEKKGYQVVQLLALPRQSSIDAVNYCMLAVQGVAEGTVAMSKQRFDGLTTEMRSRGLLDKNFYTMKVTANKSKDIKELWNWEVSKHTLAGNATIVDARRLLELSTPEEKD